MMGFQIIRLTLIAGSHARYKNQEALLPSRGRDRGNRKPATRGAAASRIEWPVFVAQRIKKSPQPEEDLRDRRFAVENQLRIVLQ